MRAKATSATEFATEYATKNVPILIGNVIGGASKSPSIIREALQRSRDTASIEGRAAPPTTHPCVDASGKQSTKDKGPSKYQPSISSASERGASTKINWLTADTMLSRAFPKARIMRFDYSSSLTEGQDGTQKFEEIATALLDELTEARQDTKRSIIFIGHSFGGLIIEKALVIASKNYANFLNTTVGVIFLAAPLGGSRAVVSHSNKLWAKTTEKTKSLSTLHWPKNTEGTHPSAAAATTINVPGTPTSLPSTVFHLYKLLDETIGNKTIRQDLIGELKRIAKDQNIRITCFFEDVQTEITKMHQKVSYFLSCSQLKFCDHNARR